MLPGQCQHHRSLWRRIGLGGPLKLHKVLHDCCALRLHEALWISSVLQRTLDGLTSVPVELYLRTDANNPVTTAASTRLPERKETVHMAQMLRQEACSGQMHDLAHVLTQYCLADPLKSIATTKHSSLVQVYRPTHSLHDGRDLP